MEKTQELISVIVPVYNVQEYLNTCVESLLAQNYSNLEIILVDDGSTDDSGKLCDVLASMDDRIRVIHKENGGLSDARNAGLAVASGQWVAFLDSDDYITPDTLERLHSAAGAYGAPMAVCNILRLYEDGETEGFYRPAEAPQVLEGNERFETLKQPSVCNKLFRRELFADVQFPRGKYYEDTFVYHILAHRAGKIALTGHDGYLYRSRRDSILGGARFTDRYFDLIEAVYARMTYLTKKRVSYYGEEACMSLYAVTSDALKHIPQTKKNRDSFACMWEWYGEACRRVRFSPHVSIRQKIRMWLLRWMPRLHNRIF